MAKSLHKRVQLLNDANLLLKSATTTIYLNVEFTPDMEVALWRVEKAIQELNKQILKQLQKDNLDDDFKDIVKDL